MKPIGLQLYSLREEAKNDFVGVLKKVAKMGYVGVEPAGLHGMTAKDVRKVLDDLGLVCCSTHGPFPTKENVAARIDEAAALGTKLLISGFGPKDFATPEARKTSVDRLNDAAGLVSGKGMMFGYHNHWWEFDTIDGEMPYDMILAEVPGMFSELDIYWARNFGTVDVTKVLAKYGKRVPLLHVKDGPLVRDQPHTAVGAGKMDIPAIVNAADPKILQWLIVELDNCGTDMATAVAASVKYLADKGLGKAKK